VARFGYWRYLPVLRIVLHAIKRVHILMVLLIGELWSDLVDERIILCFPDPLNFRTIDDLLLLNIISMAAFRTLCLRLR